MPQFPPGQTLLIDADDTLWENNVYFERAIAAFISYLNHHAYSPAEVRHDPQCSASAKPSLPTATASPASPVRWSPALSASAPARSPKKNVERILSFARSIAEQEIELLPGVAETLAELAARHRLILMTKGNHAEQADKLARSGLSPPLLRRRNRRRKKTRPPTARSSPATSSRRTPVG